MNKINADIVLAMRTAANPLKRQALTQAMLDTAATRMATASAGLPRVQRIEVEWRLAKYRLSRADLYTRAPMLRDILAYVENRWWLNEVARRRRQQN